MSQNRRLRRALFKRSLLLAVNIFYATVVQVDGLDVNIIDKNFIFKMPRVGSWMKFKINLHQV